MTIVREWVFLLYVGYVLEILVLEDGKFSCLCLVFSVCMVLKIILLIFVFEVVLIVVVSVFLINGVVYKCIFVVILGVSNFSVVLVFNNVLFIFIMISIWLVLVIDLMVFIILMVLVLMGFCGLLIFVVMVIL